jgi:hypothetical protein
MAVKCSRTHAIAASNGRAIGGFAFNVHLHVTTAAANLNACHLKLLLMVLYGLRTPICQSGLIKRKQLTFDQQGTLFFTANAGTNLIIKEKENSKAPQSQ